MLPPAAEGVPALKKSSFRKRMGRPLFHAHGGGDGIPKEKVQTSLSMFFTLLAAPRGR
jgi:hypothetical protein